MCVCILLFHITLLSNLIYNLYLASCPLRDKLTLSPLSPSAASNLPKKLYITLLEYRAVESWVNV